MKFVTLKKRREFQSVSSSGKRWVSPLFILQGVSLVPEGGSYDLENLKIGFIITKKMGNAVVRNRIRRRLKAALQLLLKTPDFQRESLASWSFVMVARRGSVSRPFENLLQEMRDGFLFFYSANPV
ncbi:MAG: ribonuclease P protein component [Holosporales bacterium]|nr:ribonuclease P protein component [Holosporales bacterium]